MDRLSPSTLPGNRPSWKASTSIASSNITANPSDSQRTTVPIRLSLFSNAKLTSDGTSYNATGTYDRLVIFIDGGVTTPGTYLIDDIEDDSEGTDPNALDVVYTDLVWADEFDTDGPVDGAKWHHQTISQIIKSEAKRVEALRFAA